jgi:hypothetical protein
MELLREVSSEKSGWAALQTMELPHVEDVQKMLDPDELLLEYYTIGDRFQAFIIGRNQYQVVRDSRQGAIRTCAQRVEFPAFEVSTSTGIHHTACRSAPGCNQHHLQDLHQQLIAPSGR